MATAPKGGKPHVEAHPRPREKHDVGLHRTQPREKKNIGMKQQQIVPKAPFALFQGWRVPHTISMPQQQGTASDAHCGDDSEGDSRTTKGDQHPIKEPQLPIPRSLHSRIGAVVLERGGA